MSIQDELSSYQNHPFEVDKKFNYMKKCWFFDNYSVTLWINVSFFGTFSEKMDDFEVFNF